VEFESAFRYIFTFIKWFTIALVTGLVGGTVGSLFHMAVNYATDFREEHTFVIYFLPLAGVLITLIYHYCGSDDDGGTNLIISSIRTKNHVPLRMAPLIFISTVITHLVGGSAGREGAALQLGGSIGNSIGELFKVRHEDIGIAVMCGMSALFSALFGTPLTACFFAMEVISVGVIYYVGLVPCIVSAFTAYKVSLFMGAEPTRFDVSQYIPEVTALTFLRTVAVAVICAFVSIVFCMAMKYVRQWFAQMTENRCIRAAAGGFFLLALTLILQTNDYNGAGMAVIERAVCEGKASTAAFLLKIVFTAITIGAGFKGGEIVPTMFIGATLGCVVSPYLGLSAQFGAAVGIAALFCSVVNCPIAAIFLSLELFGSDGIILYAAACGVSYMLSGYYGLYSSQKIVYSKLHTRYINRHTK
jgi:H+/Cl- antiporter ClcA